MKTEDALPVPPLLRNLTAVVLGVFDRQGLMVDGNRGMHYLLDLDEDRDLRGVNIARLFMQPRFDALRGGDDGDRGGVLYRGLLNLGEAETRYRSLRGAVYRDGDYLILLAEFDIPEMEKLNDTVLQLNEDMASVQRQLLRANRKLKQNEARIQELVRRDPLTQLPNRRAFDERMEFELARTERSHSRFCLSLLDIDHFKEVNDTYGHNTGDRVLQFFTAVLTDNMRNVDFFARIGGEEFALILPDTDPDMAVEVCERLRRILAASDMPELDRALTASFGITGNRLGGEEEETAVKMLERADVALYRAKQEGRNRIHCSDGLQAAGCK